MTRVHAADGSLLAEYAKERRLYLPIQAIPRLVTNAFIAAEDKNFYQHPGIDIYGITRAGLLYVENYGTRRPSAGRLHHHPAGRQELPLDQRGVVRAQDQGSAAGAAHRAHLFEARNPRTLSQRNLSRLRRLWRRRGVAFVFRQVGPRTDHRPGRLSRGAAEGAEQLQSVPAPRRSGGTAQLRHRPHGRGRLHHRRRRRQGEEIAARCHGAADRRAYLCRRIFHRGSPPLSLRQLRREEALRRRAVGAHHARSQIADGSAPDHGQRPGQFRREPRLSRRHHLDRSERRLGRQARRSEIAVRYRPLADGRGAAGRRSVGAHRAAAAARSVAAPWSRTARSASCRSTA